MAKTWSAAEVLKHLEQHKDHAYLTTHPGGGGSLATKDVQSIPLHRATVAAIMPRLVIGRNMPIGHPTRNVIRVWPGSVYAKAYTDWVASVAAKEKAQREANAQAAHDKLVATGASKLAIDIYEATSHLVTPETIVLAIDSRLQEWIRTSIETGR